VSDVAAGHILYPPEYDEFGEPVADAYVKTMTGTRGDGTRAAGATCGDWTSTSANDSAEMGSGSSGGTSWTSMWAFTFPPTGGCNWTFHLYCFEIDHQTPVAASAPKNARLAFVSTTLVPVTGGLGAGDAACAKDAAAAKLPGTYKALMGTSSISPLSRLDTKKGPWARVDGVVVTPQFFSTPIDVRADGSIYDADAWVGSADDPSNLGTYSCNDWTSTSPQVDGVVGVASWTYGYLFEAVGCDSGAKPVFCFQD
jgi:hypothetical protein